jgi:hypothetical protein
VLKTAFDGDLTASWRQKHTPPSATVLLAQIQTERDTRYQNQVADWQTAVHEWEVAGKPGRKPAKPRKPKILPPQDETELEDLPKLPEGWCWVRVGEIGIVRGGKRLPKDAHFSETETPFVYIRAGNLKGGTVTIPSPKISEIRAVEYHAFLIRRKKKAQKETTAHAGYNNHFRMFKPMS